MTFSRMVAVLAVTVLCLAGNAGADDCTTIQDGVLMTSDGRIIETGFDEWGYNYQAHSFNGRYCDAYRDADWCQPYKDVELQIKWNDAWLSNKDCDGDGLLDRHYGFDSYIGSGAWTTNHMKGVYYDGPRKHRWTYFVKIVAVPLDAVESSGYWWIWDDQAQELVAIGPVVWRDFALIQSVYNDTGSGAHGVDYLSPYSAGLGAYGPQN